MSSRFIHSSKANPCSVCGRTKDSDCRASQDGKLQLCHTEIEAEKGTIINGFKWIGKTDCGLWGKWIVPDSEPRKSPDYRPLGQEFRFPYTNENGVAICSKVRIYQQQSDGSVKKKDRWEPSGVDSSRLLPYRYLEAIEALEADPDLLLFIDESEMTADLLWQKGIPAIAFGRSIKDMRIRQLLSGLESRLAICTDQDQVGVKKAERYLRLFPMAKQIRPYPESDFWLAEWLPKSGGLDVRDWILENNLTRKEVLGAVEVQRPDLSVIEGGKGSQDVLKKPKLARQFESAQKILGSRLKLNLLTKNLELDGAALDYDELQVKIALEHSIEFTDGEIFKIGKVIAKENSYHPVREYLNSLRSDRDVSTEILDWLAKEYFGADDPLDQVFLRKTLIAAVARIFEPGCKHDTALILQGQQGINKSTFFKVLASDPWFDDSLGSISDKDEKLKLHQSWFTEWAELESVFRRRDVSQVKAFLSSGKDPIRPPYGRTTLIYPRSSIVVGTTNQESFLSDATGNRRFWVVRVRQKIDVQKLASNRDRIWAAAIAAYDAGEQWWLTEQEEALSESRNEDFSQQDPWHDAVSQYCANLPSVTTGEILTHLEIELHHRDRFAEMRVASVLKSLGWDQRRISRAGSQVRGWIAPKKDNFFGQKGCLGWHTSPKPLPREDFRHDNPSTTYDNLVQPLPASSSEISHKTSSGYDNLVQPMTTSGDEVVYDKTLDQREFWPRYDNLVQPICRSFSENSDRQQSDFNLGDQVTVLTGDHAGKKLKISAIEGGQVWLKPLRGVGSYGPFKDSDLKILIKEISSGKNSD